MYWSSHSSFGSFFFFNDTSTTEIYTLSLHDALPIYRSHMSERMHRGIILLVAMVVLTGPPGSARPRRRCGPGCQRRPCLADCESTFASNRHDCRDACLSDDVRESCGAEGGVVFHACQSGCLVGAVPGRCTLLHECVDRCRDHRDNVVAICRHQALRNCDTLADCRREAATERTQCRAACRSHTTTTSSTTTSTAPSLTATGGLVFDPLTPDDDPCSCAAQALACVQGIVGACYGECEDRRGGDPVALRLRSRG